MPARATILVEFPKQPQKDSAPIMLRLHRSSFLVLLALVSLVLSAGARAASAERFFDQTLGDLKADLATAKQVGKLGVLVMFEAEGCPYCRRMKETVLNRDDVQAYFRQRYVILSVDVLGAVPITDFAGRELSEKQFARALHVAGTPTFVFFGLDGVEQARYSGATKDARMFLDLGRFVADGHFRQQGFDAFLKTANGK